MLYGASLAISRETLGEKAPFAAIPCFFSLRSQRAAWPGMVRWRRLKLPELVPLLLSKNPKSCAVGEARKFQQVVTNDEGRVRPGPQRALQANRGAQTIRCPKTVQASEGGVGHLWLVIASFARPRESDAVPQLAASKRPRIPGRA